MFDRCGNEDDIKKVKEIYEYMIPVNIKKIVIPNSVTSIWDEAFCWCSTLASVTIPNSVTSIGRSAFARCSGLKSIIIDKSIEQVKSMENYPFGIEDESIIKCER